MRTELMAKFEYRIKNKTILIEGFHQFNQLDVWINGKMTGIVLVLHSGTSYQERAKTASKFIFNQFIKELNKYR